ncbi:hypothetical protein N7530_003063 [Penicillium desertorum]|uniref:Uncharacterized protein n=1 Tax=Penicillium desertorum TaxID=1303715 RepID=A0A9W9WVR1_9EURO|nr:hypothetical protein N7530_003063 [Penicillium desertorum]
MGGFQLCVDGTWAVGLPSFFFKFLPVYFLFRNAGLVTRATGIIGVLIQIVISFGEVEVGILASIRASFGISLSFNGNVDPPQRISQVHPEEHIWLCIIHSFVTLEAVFVNVIIELPVCGLLFLWMDDWHQSRLNLRGVVHVSFSLLVIPRALDALEALDVLKAGPHHRRQVAEALEDVLLVRFVQFHRMAAAVVDVKGRMVLGRRVVMLHGVICHHLE